MKESPLAPQPSRILIAQARTLWPGLEAHLSGGKSTAISERNLSPRGASAVTASPSSLTGAVTLTPNFSSEHGRGQDSIDNLGMFDIINLSQERGADYTTAKTFR